MRSVRLAAIALAAAALTACSNDLTGPELAPSGAALKSGYITITGAKAPVASTQSCRSGYMLSSGRCDEVTAAKAPAAPAPEAPITTQCTGWLTSTGKCE